jgi:hypothetical protein
LLTTAAVTAAGAARIVPGRAVAAAVTGAATIVAALAVLAPLRDPRPEPGRHTAFWQLRPASAWPIWVCRPPVAPD